MEAGTGQVDDLASLSNLDEETLQSELEARYRLKQIYVSCIDFSVQSYCWGQMKVSFYVVLP